MYGWWRGRRAPGRSWGRWRSPSPAAPGRRYYPAGSPASNATIPASPDPGIHAVEEPAHDRTKTDSLADWSDAYSTLRVGAAWHRTRACASRGEGAPLGGTGRWDVIRPSPPRPQDSKPRIAVSIALPARVGSKYSRRNIILPPAARRKST